VTCAVNGSVVASHDKAVLTGGGKLKLTDVYYAFRFEHNTDVLVTGLAMSKN
jgi:hypothetical protein